MVYKYSDSYIIYIDIGEYSNHFFVVNSRQKYIIGTNFDQTLI